MQQTRTHHPNREKTESKTAKAVVVFALLANAALIALVTIGGWEALEGAQMISIVYIVIYIGSAIQVARWNRGILPVAASLAVFFAIVAALSASAWFARDKPGFDNPMLDPGLLGLLTLVVIGAQLVLAILAMQAFSQKWNVEIEVDMPPSDRPTQGGAPAPLGA